MSRLPLRGFSVSGMRVCMWVSNYLKPDHKNLAMLRKIHGTNFFLIKLLNRTKIKCQNGPVLLPAQVFYFIGQVLLIKNTLLFKNLI
jgi:hypothetical protein